MVGWRPSTSAAPAPMLRAEVPSCVRVIVNVSVEIAVTRTISAFELVGCDPAGHTVALNGGAGNFAPRTRP